MKRSKILCTIGPASDNEKILEQMVEAGMNACRLNFSHGTYENHKHLIGMIRKVSKKTDIPLAIVQDLQGPRIRVGKLPKEGVELKKNKTIIFTTDKKYKDNYKDGRIYVTYENLHLDLQIKQEFVLVDGLIRVIVEKIENRDIYCKVLNPGTLYSNKGINLPHTKLRISAITEKDKDDLKFGVQMGVDWVALSFVTSAKEIFDLRYLIKAYEDEFNIDSHYSIKIIAKIEKKEAVENIDEIIDAVDGIMIARGDLGIEIPAEDVPIVQKEIILKCMENSKPVIVATQMLESMTFNPRPTRAEVNDVANSIMDHTDVVMLSGETANGKYPVETVKIMSRIIERAESSEYDDLKNPLNIKKETIADVISYATTLFTVDKDVCLILVGSVSGLTARMISRHRPELDILVATMDERVRRQLNLSWGVKPFVLPRVDSIEEFNDRSIAYLKKKKYVERGDQVLIIAGEPVGVSGHMNLLEIRDVL